MFLVGGRRLVLLLWLGDASVGCSTQPPVALVTHDVGVQTDTVDSQQPIMYEGAATVV